MQRDKKFLIWKSQQNSEVASRIETIASDTSHICLERKAHIGSTGIISRQIVKTSIGMNFMTQH